MIVKKKDLMKFFELADLYFISFGCMNESEYEFVSYFIERYGLEKEKRKKFQNFISKLIKSPR